MVKENPNSNPNPSEKLRQEFDAVTGRPWPEVEAFLLKREGKPFLLTYREIDAKNFQNGIVDRYVIGIVDRSAWAELSSPKCLKYGQDCPVTAIGNLAYYFTQPGWAWEKKKIVRLSFHKQEIVDHLSFVFDKVRRASMKAEENIRNRVDPKPEEVEDDIYVYMILYPLLKLLSDSSFGERMEKYKDFLRSSEEFWRKREAYFRLRMIFAKKMFRTYGTIRKIFDD